MPLRVHNPRSLSLSREWTGHPLAKLGADEANINDVDCAIKVDVPVNAAGPFGGATCLVEAERGCCHVYDVHFAIIVIAAQSIRKSDGEKGPTVIVMVKTGLVSPLASEVLADIVTFWGEP